MPYNFKENVATSEKTEGLWNVFEDERGNSSLAFHTPKLIWQSCENDSCTFELSPTQQRLFTCTRCGLHKTYILGMHKLRRGKIVSALK